MNIKSLLEKRKGRNSLGDLGVDGRIMFKLYLDKYDGKV
jgi:hypothetical protein